MTYVIKQSSTEAALLFFLVQSADHITGLTGATPTVTISKNGAAFASPSGAVSEIGNGWYKVAANATDTNTLGPLALHATAASADPCDIVVANIVAYDPQDAVHLGLSALPNTACTTNASLLTSGTGTDQLQVASGIASADVKKWNGTTVATPATAGVPDINVKNINNVAAATPGASGGVLIAGTNAATTIDGLTLTGTAASGSTPATAGLTVTGGAASTTGGGTSAAAIVATGGAGAASTNGAAAGATFTAGGTTTVSGNDGMVWTGTGNGNGVTAAHAGTGKDLNAQTTNSLQVNATAINSVSASSVSAINANIGTTQPVNFTGSAGSALVKSDMVDVAGAAVSASTAQLGVNVVNIGGSVSTGAAGYVGIDWGHINAPTTAQGLSGTTISTSQVAASVTAGVTLASPPGIRKNVALNNFMFQMRDSTTHAPKTGVTVTVTRSIDGAAFAAGTLSAVTEISSGWYAVNFAAADLNGTVIAFRATGASSDDTNIFIHTDP